MQTKSQDWMFYTLVIAGIYNLAWGAWVILFPSALFNLLDMQPPLYLEIWQCVGMIVGVYGLGYMAAATKPLIHWPIVLVGFLGKIFGPLGFAQALITEKLPLKFGLTLLTNDFIWWIPFFLILKRTWEAYQEKPVIHHDQFVKNLPEHIQQKAKDNQIFFIFLRHCGCTFTREALSFIKKVRLSGDKALCIVYMGDVALAKKWEQDYGLQDILWAHDPNRQLYISAGLAKAKFTDLLSLKLILKAVSGLKNGHGVGPMQGDGFQMPGVFSLKGETLTEIYKYKDMSANPDFSLLFSKS